MTDATTFSTSEKERYRRHLLLPEIGGQGQKALKASSVLVIGAGGLGCPLLSYLAAAGVGQITILDPDHVELSNLQRQTLYSMDDLGQPKATIAAQRLRALNPDITIDGIAEAFTENSDRHFVEQADLVIEGVDRFAARYVINAACRQAAKPLLSVAIGRFDGQIAHFRPGQANHPCYRCFVPESPTTEADCETEGVLGAVPGIVGAMAASEAIKLLTGMASALEDELLIYSGLQTQLRKVRLRRNPTCPDCSA